MPRSRLHRNTDMSYLSELKNYRMREQIAKEANDKMRAEVDEWRAKAMRAIAALADTDAKLATRESEYLRGAKMLAENASEWARRAEIAEARVAELEKMNLGLAMDSHELQTRLDLIILHGPDED